MVERRRCDFDNEPKLFHQMGTIEQETEVGQRSAAHGLLWTREVLEVVVRLKEGLKPIEFSFF